MVSEFLNQRGLQRMESLLSQHHNDLSGVLFGQLLNCALYSRKSVIIQSSLVCVSDWANT